LRDGNHCFYCEKEFEETHPAEFDHLNDDPGDNRPDNLVLVHHECNNRKKFNPDYQIQAKEKLLQNEKSTFTCAGTEAWANTPAGTAIDKKMEFVMGNGVRPTFELLPDTGSTQQLSSQQEISKINNQITKQWIQEHTLMEDEVVLKDAVNAIVSICQDNNETGSQSAVHRYIEVLTNPYTGKYTLSKNSEGKTIIRRRIEN